MGQDGRGVGWVGHLGINLFQHRVQDGAQLVGLVADLRCFDHFQSQRGRDQKRKRAGGVGFQARCAPAGAFAVALAQLLGQLSQIAVVSAPGFFLQAVGQDGLGIRDVLPAGAKFAR